MKIEALYNPMLVTAEAWEPLVEVAARMRFNEVGSAAVFEHGRLAGIITERDLVRAMVERADLDNTTAADFMTSEPAYVEPETDAADAARLMLDLGVRHLPVITDHQLIGMVSIRDVLLDAVWNVR
jgi:CBS domain-containing protein